MLLLLDILKVFAFLVSVIVGVLAALAFIVAIPLAVTVPWRWWQRALLAVGLLVPLPLCIWLLVQVSAWAGLD